MNDLKNLDDLFGNDNDALIKALNFKKRWLDRILYIGVDFDDTNRIEALKKSEILFEAPYFDSRNFEQEEAIEILKNSLSFAVCDFLNEIDKKQKYDFYVAYDFRHLDFSDISRLAPNIYHKMSFKKLEIKKENITKDIKETIKALIIGNSNESRIILSREYLLDMCYYSKVLEHIYFKEGTSEENMQVLREIALANRAELEELYEN